MRRLQHQFSYVSHHRAPTPDDMHAATHAAACTAARRGRPHRWYRRFAAPSLPDSTGSPMLRRAASLTGVHYMAMPDADTRDALEALVSAWRQAADAFGESMIQYAERRLFEGRHVPMPVVDTPPPPTGAPFAVRAVTHEDMQQFENPVVRIEVHAPDTLAGLGSLMVRWSVLAEGRAWDFIEIGCLRMLHEA